MTLKSKRRPAARKSGSGADKIAAAFGVREGTNRAKLLARLGRNLGKPVAVPELMKAVYGADDDEPGKLMRVVAGAFVMIEKHKPGYRLAKAGEGRTATFTLAAKR